MITVDRSLVPIPKALRKNDYSKGMVELERAIKFYEQPLEERIGSKFRFKVYMDTSIRKALVKLFHGKCAYCESLIQHVEIGDLEHYRPKSSVIGADGTHHPDHYFWLANDWDNLLISCTRCNRKHKNELLDGKYAISGKGDHFPILNEENRAPILTTGKALDNEGALILNPCEDEPADHLTFLEDGSVVSETKRGQVTIEILGLNRMDLVNARLRKVHQINEAKELLEKAVESQELKILEMVVKQLREFRQPYQEYAGLARQFIRVDVLEDAENSITNFEVLDTSQILNKMGEFEKFQEQRENQQKKAHKAFSKFKTEQQQYSLEDEQGMEKYFTGPSRFVEEVQIRNLKSIKKLDLLLSGGGDTEVPWTMILGENGTGKSTILQAIAIALIGQSYYQDLISQKIFDPLSMLRMEEEKGWVSVRITGFPKPRKVVFHRDGRVDFTDSESAQNLVLAYGSTRLMPRGTSDGDYGRYYARVENLFNPFLPMANANLWLSSLNKYHFLYTAQNLMKLLRLPKKSAIIAKDDMILVRTQDGTLPLNSLSDGYQSTLALIADILKVVLSKWPTPESAQGIVLLDEVGNHLHPEWKMRFVQELRDFFPKIQFITTTHNPLCLYGLEDGEVIVVKRTPRGSIYEVPDLPSISGLRVDQILTSEHFGLGSATDPETQQYLDEYYKLLRDKSKSATSEKRTKELKKIIDERQRLGKTARERMLLEVIDQFLAEKQYVQKVPKMEHLKAETMNKLREIWNS